MLCENLRIFLNASLIPCLRCLYQHQQGHIGFQEGVGHMVHHCLAQLEERKSGTVVECCPKEEKYAECKVGQA